ncbi:histidine ammonia-lyase [Corynebacterium appendicis CIP 107643]|uniref:Histidine ammonia-lyase n=1 Tax=Corynebacterium appendicis CIP 107643 TaxID=1161099 RepID=A0A1N7JF07_9CORY|nr:aromatic amino acid lyase [Corynebacterium appendicis]WJY60703.1 histidine ammonia-lyase [Corynebacterium appendicis CIP 107643]SIS47844.1 histidine ammonia-lyase [Corynebacterium appendicis CIP 107643]
MFRVSDVSQWVLSGHLGTRLTEKREVIEQQREQVDRYLETGGVAYGFTTLFGHLDAFATSPSALLLEGHTVGRPSPITQDLFRSILAVKLCQLSNGGSGISPETFDLLIETFQTPPTNVEIDLEASYGCGDVVPGAWLAKSLFESEPDLRAGDLMCLMNGSYFGAGVALHTNSEMRDLFEEAWETLNAARETALAVQGDSTVQLPVSLRDLQPLRIVIDRAEKNLQIALEHSLNANSGNPLFEFERGTAKPVSNSSFLDFQLSLSLNETTETCKVVSSYLVGATRWLDHLAEATLADEAKPLSVQFPKISKAYHDTIVASSGNASYAQAESRDIEDVSDSSLIRALKLKRFLGLLSHQIGFLTSILKLLEN